LSNIFDKKNLTERDICTKYITPAIVETAGWNRDTQIREELSLTKGKVLVHGKLHSRGKQKRADYVLYHKTKKRNSLTVRLRLSSLTITLPAIYSRAMTT
jgi:type I site-specific restriction endonuclease